MQWIKPKLCWVDVHKYSSAIVTYWWAFWITQDSIPNMDAYIETELHCQQQRDPSKCIILWVNLHIEQQTLINVNRLIKLKLKPTMKLEKNKAFEVESFV